MPKKQKPPGMEKWTWEEIRCGRKMSKSEKRMRRIAKGFGATERQNGSIKHSAESAFVCGLVIVLMILLAILAECSHR
jgi:hypothetical protein